MEKKRIEWIDAIKGFAIICVVLGHIVKGYMDADLYTQHTVLMHSIYNAIYAFHMPLFFTISGFLFHEAYIVGTVPNSYVKTNSVNRQMINLLLLYIAYSIILGSSKMMFASAVTNKVTVMDLLMIWTKPIQLFWYLYVLLMYYALFRIDKIRNANNYIMLTIFGIVSAIIGFVPAIDWFQINNFLYYAFFFALGVYYTQILCHKKVMRGGIQRMHNFSNSLHYHVEQRALPLYHTDYKLDNCSWFGYRFYRIVQECTSCVKNPTLLSMRKI